MTIFYLRCLEPRKDLHVSRPVTWLLLHVSNSCTKKLRNLSGLPSNLCPWWSWFLIAYHLSQEHCCTIQVYNMFIGFSVHHLWWPPWLLIHRVWAAAKEYVATNPKPLAFLVELPNHSMEEFHFKYYALLGVSAQAQKPEYNLRCMISSNPNVAR